MKSLQNTPTVPLDVERGADLTDGHGGQKMEKASFYFSVNMLGYDTTPCRLSHRE